MHTRGNLMHVDLNNKPGVFGLTFRMVAIFTLFYYFFTPTLVSGQNRITGEVKGDGEKPLPFVTVLLLALPDTSFVKGEVTSQDGKFVFDAKQTGPHLVEVSMVGFKKVYSTPFDIKQGNPIILPAFRLIESPSLLQEVNVRSQRPVYEQLIDRLVVNVASSVSMGGGNVLEILERSPGVVVNQQSGTIGMNGKTGVMVMINGKLSRMTSTELIQYLSGIPSNSIEKLELITTPPAKYDAEGNGGLINIILKRTEGEGTNGSLALTGGMGFRPKMNGTANINFKGQKASIYGDVSEIREYGRNPFQFFRKNVVDGNLMSLQTDLLRLWMRNVFTVNVGTEWYPGPKTTIGIQASGFSNIFKITSEPSTNFLTKNGLPDTRVTIERDERSVWKNALGSVRIQHKINANSEFSVDSDLVLYKSDLTAGYDNGFEYFTRIPAIESERMNTSKQTGIRMLVTKADYSLQLPKVRLEAGAKGTFSGISNDVVLDRTNDSGRYIDPDFTSAYKLRDYIGAGYVNLSGNYKAKRIAWQAGLRSEYSFTHLYSREEPNLVLRRYLSLFPSFSASWQATAKSQYQASYSRRISRPEYTQIAPFIAFYGWENFGSGNPRLKPSFTDNVQVNYVINNAYTLTVVYSQQKNAIVGYQAQIDTVKNRFFTNPQNIEHINTLSLMGSAPLKVNSWWQIQTSVQYALQSLATKHQGEQLRLSTGFWQLTGQQNFVLGNGLNADISYNWVSKMWQGAGLAVPFGGFNAGIQKKLKGTRGTFRLIGTDLFWTFRAGLTFDYPNTDTYINWRLKLDTRTIRLSYSRSFGNNKVKTARRSTGSEEERKRVTF